MVPGDMHCQECAGAWMRVYRIRAQAVWPWHVHKEYLQLGNAA